MHLSKLIPILQHIYDNYGDLDVEVQDSEYDAESLLYIAVDDGGSLGKTVQLGPTTSASTPTHASKTLVVWNEEQHGIAWAERPEPPPDVQFQPWSTK